MWATPQSAAQVPQSRYTAHKMLHNADYAALQMGTRACAAADKLCEGEHAPVASAVLK